MSYLRSLFIGTVLCFFLLPTLSSAQDKLIIISPHPEGIETEFGKNFETWYKAQTLSLIHI